jgi:hypothetical protein
MAAVLRALVRAPVSAISGAEPPVRGAPCSSLEARLPPLPALAPLLLKPDSASMTLAGGRRRR